MNRGRNSPPVDVIPQPKGSGLALWRHRQSEDRKERLEALAKLREDAETVIRDGREFRLVRIPDRYEWTLTTEGGR